MKHLLNDRFGSGSVPLRGEVGCEIEGKRKKKEEPGKKKKILPPSRRYHPHPHPSSSTSPSCPLTPPLAYREAERAMLISELADELLSLICAFDGPSRVPALFLCGNQTLNTRLKRCIRIFSGNNPNVMSIFTRIPGVLSQLNALRVVQIGAFLSQPQPLVIASQLKILPPTLEELHIQCNGLGPAFATICGPPSLISAQSTSISGTHEPHVTKWEFKSCLPRMQKLELIDYSSDDRFAITSQHLAIFPESLLTLRWDHVIINSPHDYSMLPRGLNSLELPTSKTTPNILKSLPPRLQHVRFGCPISDIKLLPRTLTSVPELDVMDFDPKMAAALPPALTQLTYINPKESVSTMWSSQGGWLQALPKGLTSLAFGSSPPLTAQVIGYLPRTITNMEELLLEAGTLAEIAETGADVWPRPLVKLSLRAYRSTNETDVLGLPQSLTHLILLGSSLIDSLSHRLPPQLRHLDAYIGHYTPKQVHFNSLPSTLTSIMVFDAELSDSSLKALPAGLRHLRVPDAGILSEECASVLPKSLRRLRLAGITARALRHLPSTLVELIIEKGVEGLIEAEDIRNLPRGLTHLGWKFTNTNSETFPALQYLPETLITLNMSTVNGVQVLPHLPDSIKSIKMRLGGISKSGMFELLPSLSDRWVDWLSRSCNAYKDYIQEWRKMALPKGVQNQ